jgi:hypothetical protein
LNSYLLLFNVGIKVLAFGYRKWLASPCLQQCIFSANKYQLCCFCVKSSSNKINLVYHLYPKYLHKAIVWGIFVAACWLFAQISCLVFGFWVDDLHAKFLHIFIYYAVEVLSYLVEVVRCLVEVLSYLVEVVRCLIEVLSCLVEVVRSAVEVVRCSVEAVRCSVEAVCSAVEAVCSASEAQFCKYVRDFGTTE